MCFLNLGFEIESDPLLRLYRESMETNLKHGYWSSLNLELSRSYQTRSGLSIHGVQSLQGTLRRLWSFRHVISCLIEIFIL